MQRKLTIVIIISEFTRNNLYLSTCGAYGTTYGPKCFKRLTDPVFLLTNLKMSCLTFFVIFQDSLGILHCRNAVQFSGYKMPKLIKQSQIKFFRCSFVYRLIIVSFIVQFKNKCQFTKVNRGCYHKDDQSPFFSLEEQSKTVLHHEICQQVQVELCTVVYA